MHGWTYKFLLGWSSVMTQYRITWRIQNFSTCNGKKCVKYSMNGHDSTYKILLKIKFFCWWNILWVVILIDAPSSYWKENKWSNLLITCVLIALFVFVMQRQQNSMIVVVDDIRYIRRVECSHEYRELFWSNFYELFCQSSKDLALIWVRTHYPL